MKFGETSEECLAREIAEELSMDITSMVPFLKIDYDYGTFFMRLYSFLCRAEGSPVVSCHTEVRWVEPQDLNNLDWAPADRTLVSTLQDKS